MNRLGGRQIESGCARCTVRNAGLCSAMVGYEAVRTLDTSHAPVRVLKPGEIIYHQGDASDRIYNVVSGWVGLQSNAFDGRHGLLHLAVSGDMFGMEPLDGGFGHSAWAITTAAVCAIGKDRLRQLRESYSDLNERFIWMVEREGRLNGQALEALLMSPAPARVTFLLWSLAVRSLRRRPRRGEEIWIPLSQVALAAAVGLTAVHLNRTLHELRERELLTFSGRQLIVWDPQAAEELCGSTDELVGLWVCQRGAPSDRPRMVAETGPDLDDGAGVQLY
jgi:CRP-like cAMP-binding protein